MSLERSTAVTAPAAGRGRQRIGHMAAARPEIKRARRALKGRARR
jgi:hypothetical protein